MDLIKKAWRLLSSKHSISIDIRLTLEELHRDLAAPILSITPRETGRGTVGHSIPIQLGYVVIALN